MKVGEGYCQGSEVAGEATDINSNWLINENIHIQEFEVVQIFELQCSWAPLG